MVSFVVQDSFEKIALTGVTFAVINAANYFTQKIAYDALGLTVRNHGWFAGKLGRPYDALALTGSSRAQIIRDMVHGESGVSVEAIIGSIDHG